MTDQVLFNIDWTLPKGNATRGAITIRFGDDSYVNRIDILDAKARQGLVAAACERWPALNKPEHCEALTEQLDRLAVVEASRRNGDHDGPAVDSDPGHELDASRIVRPERIITPEVSAIAMPTVSIVAGRPVAQWHQYLCWSDGRRERAEMRESIDLSDNHRLWINPVPSAPTPSMAQSLRGWSGPARQQWLAAGDGPDPADLFKRLCERIEHFIDLPKHQAPGITATLALWVVLTYCYVAWDAVPYLYVGGTKGSGKSTVFKVLKRLVFRPLGSSNLTGAALFRTLDNQGGTLLFDEAERLKQSKDPEVGGLVSMLLAGYQRGGQAIRLESVGDKFNTVAFDVFGPKALACIAGLPGPLLDRCIPIMMFRAAPGSPKPRRRIDDDPEGWRSLRDDLHALALNHGQTWLELAKRSGVCPSMSGRDYELWQPLLALADWFEGQGVEGLLKLAQDHALATIEQNKDDQTPDHDETLLRILTEEIRNERAPRAGEILDRAKLAEPEAFRKWSARGVASHLKLYGLRTNKSHGVKVYGRVTLDDLQRVQDAYGVGLGFERESEAA